MGKAKSSVRPPPVLYRDEPDLPHRSSMSSSVLLNDIEYPEEETPLTGTPPIETPLTEGFPDDELPPYSDIPAPPGISLSTDAISYLAPPPIPQSTLTRDKRTTITHSPIYSQDASILEGMIREQAAYPPIYALHLRGTHTETFKNREGKTQRKTVVDFDFRVNMTHLLVCPSPVHTTDIRPCGMPLHAPRTQEPPQEYWAPSCKYIKILGPGEQGYRGTIVKSLKGASDPEACTSLTSWCNAYISDPHTTKAFVLQRQILHHDTERLVALCLDLVHKTAYRGHTFITFETTHEKVLVYSPSLINKWRSNDILYWVFIVTFLWIITWPVLFFLTARYETVTAIFPYRLDPQRNQRTAAKPLVQSEQEFFEDWKQALNRAVLSQHQGWVDGIYREETAQMARSGRLVSTVQSTQNSLLGLGSGAIRLALGVPAMTGWGADS